LSIFLTGYVLQINISNIPEEGLNLRFSKSGEWFHQFVPADGGPGFRVRKIEAGCFVEKVLKNVSVKGTIKACIELECCRCLEKFSFPLEVEFRDVLSPTEELKKDELELSYEDLEYKCYEGDVIEIDQIVVEQVILQIPVKPLCNDSCKGLCPVCGINLNMDTCDHKMQQINSPFAALKNFKSNREG